MSHTSQENDDAGMAAFHKHANAWLDRVDSGLYVLVAALLAVAAVGMGIYAVVNLIQNFGDNVPLQIFGFVNNLLLVLIILELMGTVRSYLATGTTSLEPFLYIGIISAARRILSIGAETTLGILTSESEFDHLMIDLTINAGVVLALGIALYLFRRGTAGQPGEVDAVSF